MTRPSQPPYPWPPEQAQPRVSKPCRTTHGVAVVVAGDSAFPLLADLTAPFVYARAMGTTVTEQLGYSSGSLDVWAKRARAWAKGGEPPDLATVGAPVANAAGRDVFLYVISGFKALNPAAAMGLIERLR